MGCVTSAEQKRESSINSKVNKQLDKSSTEDEIKLLLLGTGESGKSTILKQLRIIHGKGFPEDEIRVFKEQINGNLIKAVLDVAKSFVDMDLLHTDPDISENVTYLINMKTNLNLTEEKVLEAIKSMKDHPGLKIIFENAGTLEINDSTPYYFENFNRIISPDYVPNDDDIVRIRCQTTGIIEVPLRIKELNIRLCDVGGQRSERKKWIHCFDGVTAIIFIVALTEYDRCLSEDPTVNRLHESLNLFRSIINNKFFADKPVLLFLNKRDLFSEKIKQVPITKCFPEYTGSQDEEDSTAYVRKKFEDISRESGENRSVYSQVTCATDKSNIQFVFDSATDIIVKKNLRELGLY